MACRLVLAASVWGLVACPSYARGADGIMPTRDVKPGMKGYGLTVFSGTQVERFNVEVISVLKNAFAKGDMILIRMSGGPLAKTGIIAGMSGSPVYINEKLIGAVAYGWTYAKEPIAGVTPVEEMLSMLAPAPKVAAAQAGKGWARDIRVDAVRAIPPDSRLEVAALSEPASLRPIQTPLMISGFHPEVIARMREELAPFGIVPVAAGGVAERPRQRIRPSPGSAIAVQLIRGDVESSAVGTLTFVRGRQMLGFGHPMFHAGDVDIPLALASVHAVMPSLRWSFKMASPVQEIGRLVEDRRPGIRGVAGERCKMIPCTVGVAGAKKSVYHFEVFGHKFWTSRLASWALQDAMLATERSMGEGMVRVHATVRVRGRREPVRVENTFFEPRFPWVPACAMANIVQQLQENPFTSVRVEAIEFAVSFDNKRRTAAIEAVRSDRKGVRPGEEINVSVLLRPFGQPPTTRRARIKIPPDVVPGSTATITACDARTSRALHRTRSPGTFRPENFEQYIDLIQRIEDNESLFVRTTWQRRGITLRGEALPSLPSSLLSVFSFSNTSGVGPMITESVAQVKTPWVLTGSQTVVLVVKQRR